ncbi:hypothetical protein [Treponema pedis]|uniref:hypothetical protein n=1 Tax=Treponema pedis TaxID=409322 RepID=UPI0031340278
MKKIFCGFLFFVFSFFVFPQSDTENEKENPSVEEEIELIKNRTGENKAGLYFKDIERDKAVLFLDGFWEASFLGIASFEFSKGYSKLNSIQPIFKQKAHLSLWLLLNRQFYFETLYKDDYKKSIIAMGYFGKEDSAVKHIRAGNSGIKFPSNYGFINSGGGNIIAPGIMGTFAGDNWQADTMFRYESSEYNSKFYYGTNEINKTKISINSWNKARHFYIPAVNLYGKQLQILVKDYSGGDWRELPKDEFSINARENTLALKKSFPAGVAVNYLYSLSEESAADTFLNSVKLYFAGISEIENNIKPLIRNYAENIRGKSFLILKTEDTFSPFEIASRYDVPQTGSSHLINVVSSLTEDKAAQFTSQINSGDFFSDGFIKINFIQIINKNFPVDFSKPEQIFPFVNSDYKIYIPSNTNEDLSLQILCESYTLNQEFSIPDTAVPGSIRIYKNKIEIFNFVYNEKTNIITFHEEILPNDLIEIRWKESKTYSDSGTVKFASGVHWRPISGLDIFFANSGDWEIAKQKQQLTDVYKFSSGAEFSKYNIKAGSRFGFDIVADRNGKPKGHNYIFKNKTYFDYTAKEILLKKNDEPIFSNPHFYVDGDFQTESKKEDTKINSKMEAGMDLWKIKLEGNLSLQNKTDIAVKNSKKKIIESYGHSVFIPIYFFTASENYFVNQNENILRRSCTLGFEKYISAKYLTSIDYNKEFTNSKIFASLSPIIPEKDFGIIYSEINFGVSQRYKTVYDISNTGYTQSWKKSLTDMYSKGEQYADNRNSELKFIFNFFSNNGKTALKDTNFLGFNFEASVFTKVNNRGLSQCEEQTRFSVSVPFEIKKIFFTPVWERKILKTKPEAETKKQNGYSEDIYFLFKGMGEQFWLFSKPVFYDLIDKKINTQIQINNFNNYAFYNLYGLNISRIISSSITDLYIPLEFNTAFSRIVKSEKTFPQGLNIYGMDFAVKYTTLNISGKFGYFNWFTWYEQDELNRTYKWNFSFGKDFFKFKFNSIHTLYYFFAERNNLGFENEFNCFAVKTENTSLKTEEWKEKFSVILTLASSSSLPHLIIRLFSKIPLLDSREEKLSVEFSKIPNLKKLNYLISFKHSQITKIGEHGEIKIFAELTGSSTKKDSFLLNISAGLAGKVEY